MGRAADPILATTSTSRLDPGARPQLPPVPGLVAIFASGRPTMRVFRLEGEPIAIGRPELAEGDAVDPAISRRHAQVGIEEGSFVITDLGSRNGTFVDGKPAAGGLRAPAGSLIRIGGALLLAAADVVGFERYGLGLRDGIVGGPALRCALEAVVLHRGSERVTSLLLTGESGTGKEIAARTFHAFGPRPSAPFVAVNCAAIPRDLAERLIFGSRRGAFSGATDAPGYVQAAHGGTLFLDEIAELPPDVQSKLLRLLETREVMRLGATSYESIDVRICTATWRNLRHEVGAGRFREDLYFRIAPHEVRLPALRERIEEIPWHIQQGIDECAPAAGRLRASTALIEACARRRWQGNVRELRAEIRRIAALALAQGIVELGAEELGATAGQPISRRDGPASSAGRFPEDEFAAALAATGGNVALTARQLGVHRNKVRRWLERHRIDAARFKRKGRARRP